MLLATATLLHILVFVYWLGGDLGVFYSSTILTDTKTSAQGRIIAAKVLAQVDMAPRTAMILTLPTGLTLADQAGYLSLAIPVLVGAWILGFAWLALAWTIHLKHLPPSSLWRKADKRPGPVVSSAQVGDPGDHDHHGSTYTPCVSPFWSGVWRDDRYWSNATHRPYHR
jgi:hypothetical protein